MTINYSTKRYNINDLSTKNNPFIQLVDSDVDYYIATTGNDTTGDGTALLPFATLGRALKELQNYFTTGTGTIHIADGTYVETNEIKGLMGNVVIEGNTSNPENVILDGDAIGSATCIRVRTSSAYIKFDGLTIINSYYGIYGEFTNIELGNVRFVNNYTGGHFRSAYVNFSGEVYVDGNDYAGSRGFYGFSGTTFNIYNDFVIEKVTTGFYLDYSYMNTSRHNYSITLSSTVGFAAIISAGKSEIYVDGRNYFTIDCNNAANSIGIRAAGTILSIVSGSNINISNAVYGIVGTLGSTFDSGSDATTWTFTNCDDDVVLDYSCIDATYDTFDTDIKWVDDYVDTDTFVNNYGYDYRYVQKLVDSKAIYVATTGSDETGNGTSGSPYATIQKAIYSLPQYIDTSIVIYVGAGTFTENVFIPNKTLTENGIVIIQGNKTSTATLTATGGAANTDGYGTLEVSGAGWTPDEHKKSFVEIITKTSSDSERYDRFIPIYSNTTDTLTLPILNFTPSGDTTFKIVSNNTIVNASGGTAFNFANAKLSKDYYLDGDLYYYLRFNLLNLDIRDAYYGIYNDGSVVMYSGCNFSNSDLVGDYINITLGEGYSQGQGIITSGRTSYILTGYGIGENYISDLYSDFTEADGTHRYGLAGFENSSLLIRNSICEGNSDNRINTLVTAYGNSRVLCDKIRVDYCNNLKRSTGGYVDQLTADSIYGTNIGKEVNISFGGYTNYISNSNITPTTPYDLTQDGSMYRYISADDVYLQYYNMIVAKSYAANTDDIHSSIKKINATCSSALTLTSTPTITAGLFTGQELEIYGTSDTNTLTIQDDGTLAGSNVLLKSGTSVTLANGDMVKFFWNGTSWIEKYRSIA